MSAPTKVASRPGDRIHLPSVHVRDENDNGFDYEEDLYVRGRGRRKIVKRVVRLAMVEGGRETLVRETFDILCPDDLANLEESLPILIETDILGDSHPDAAAHMQERARYEFARQVRIAAGAEQFCRRCGCSETRACSGGCIWATPNSCSRCIL